MAAIEHHIPGLTFLRHVPSIEIDTKKHFRQWPDWERRGGDEYVVNNLGPLRVFEVDSDNSADRNAGRLLAVETVQASAQKPDIIIAVRSHLRSPVKGDPNAQNEAMFYRKDLHRLGLAREVPTPYDSPTFSAACSSLVYAYDWLRKKDPVGANVLIVADETDYRRTLLLPAEDDQKTGLLMSDFAISMQGQYGRDFTVLASQTHYIPEHGDLLKMRVPKFDPEDPYLHVYPPPYGEYFLMQGARLRRMFNEKINKEEIEQMLEQASTKVTDLAAFLSHQASIGMVRDVHKIFPDIPYKPTGVVDYGNTSSASTMVDLEDAIKNGFIKVGDRSLVLAFGGGLSWGAAVIKTGE